MKEQRIESNRINQANHKEVMSDFSFAMKPSEESEGGVGVLEVEGPSPSNNNTDDNNRSHNSPNRRPRAVKIKKLGKKLGGALQKINVVKWIDDLEQDQNLADQLDRVNADTADEQERKDICRQAMEACMNAIGDHLQEFLSEHPQATYEEWICNLHPDNINNRMEGLTQTPMIDHRFYVANSDHRVLWNEHLNDLDDPHNLTPVRHFVAARSFQPTATTITASSQHQHQHSMNSDKCIVLEEDRTLETRSGLYSTKKQTFTLSLIS